MVRVEDLDITFFHVAKNAGSSIASWLEINVGGEEYHEDLRHAQPTSLEPLFDDFGWTFCVVRNPWDRMVSWYEFFRKQNRVDCSFDTFLDRSFGSERSRKYYKPLDYQKQVADYCDYVIRYENLIEDFKVVQEKTNCFVPLFDLNKSPRQKINYMDYYTDAKYVDLIRNRHAEELEHFGYEFGG